MDIVSLCQLQAQGFVWQSRAGAFAQTVIVKATYLLRPGEAALAPAQDAVNEEDNHWNDDATRSVYAPSDRVPFKPKADVLLVGHAFASGKQPVRSLMARMVVGELNKSIEVWCDRGVRLRDEQLLEGPRFAKMPLRWERAAGGPETSNPVGMRFDAAPDMYGMVGIPNLQPPGMFVSQRSDTFAPVCFAPIAPSWPGRAQKLGRLAGTFLAPGWESRPLPEELDYGYFQAAPADQQVSELRANERIVLENLHPDHPRLVTSLPGIRPRAVAERATGEREDVALVADTLWIDADRGICTLVWRGRIGLRSASEAGRIAVSLEPGAEEVETPEPEEENARDPTVTTMALSMGAGAGVKPVMPFAGGSGPSGAPRSSTPASRVSDAALPFGQAGLAAMRAVEPAPLPLSGDGTTDAPMVRKAPAPAMPAIAPPPPPAQSSRPPLPVANPLPAVVPPPMMTRPPVFEPIAPPVSSSPWALGDAGGAARPAPLSIGPMITGSSIADAQARGGDKPASLGPISPASAESQEKPLPAKDAALGGAAAASNEAAEKAARVLAKSLTGRASVELIWLNAGSMARIRKQTAWKELLSGVKVRPEDEDLDDDLPPGRRIPAKDRREVLAVLSRGEPLDVAGVEEALYRAIDDDGGFTPPLVLAAGELAMRFDELETLKATLAALAPLAPGDKRLEEAVARVQEMFKMPWTQGANGVLEETTANLRKLFAESRKSAQMDAFDTQVEQTLLEQRHYRKRTVFGQPRVVGALSMPGMKAVIPVYLPDSLGKELPGLRQMGVRMIGEVRPRAEQGEMSQAALRGVAVGRVVNQGW